MSLIRYNPLSLATSRWPSIWDDEDFFTSTSRNSLQISQDEKTVTVEANVAGVDKKDIDLTFEKGVLWIQAQSEKTEEDDRKTTSSSWSYSYKVAVPGDIDVTKDPDATVKNGVLQVVFEKSQAAQPRKVKIV